MGPLWTFFIPWSHLSPPLPPPVFFYAFMYRPTDRPLLMDNLEPPPTQAVPAPLLGSCPQVFPLSSVTSHVRVAHTGSHLGRLPNLSSF